MKQQFYGFVQFVLNYLMPATSHKDEVMIQTVYGSGKWIKRSVLFTPIRHLIEDGTPKRAQLLVVIAGAFNNNPNVVVGEVTQALAYELAQRGMTGEQCQLLDKLLDSWGLGLGTEIFRPTWQELMDEVNDDLEERSDRSPMGRSGPT